jgi:phosphate transport system protein
LRSVLPEAFPIKASGYSETDPLPDFLIRQQQEIHRVVTCPVTAGIMLLLGLCATLWADTVLRPPERIRHPISSAGLPMSTASVKTPPPEPSHSGLVRRTVEACELAREAAAIAAEGIATGSMSHLNAIRQCEKELDAIDVEVDSGVTSTITHVPEAETRQLLACMKVMIGLERIGDLLLSFATSAQAAGGRLDSQDARDLTQMATILERMLADVGQSFSQRDVKKAIDVLRADAEMDRLRNLIFLRHIENPENVAHHSSLQVIFMTQSLERAGDHAKNLAEEVCHFVSGRSIRHLLMAYDKPKEQMFIEWLRHKEEKSQ